MQNNRSKNSRQILDDWEKYARVWVPKSEDEHLMLDAFLLLCLSKMTANEIRDLDTGKMRQTFQDLNSNKVTLKELADMSYEDFSLLLGSGEGTSDEK